MEPTKLTSNTSNIELSATPIANVESSDQYSLAEDPGMIDNWIPADFIPVSKVDGGSPSAT